MCGKNHTVKKAQGSEYICRNGGAGMLKSYKWFKWFESKSGRGDDELIPCGNTINYCYKKPFDFPEFRCIPMLLMTNEENSWNTHLGFQNTPKNAKEKLVLAVQKK